MGKSTILALTLILVFLLALTGCGGGGGGGGNSGNSSGTSLIGGSVQGQSLSLSQAVTTVAGSAGVTGSSNGTGTAARFYSPRGITTDGANLYAVDWNHTIRKIVIATGAVTTLAGSAGVTGSADGTGAAAKFNCPTGITTDGTNLYVTDWNNNTIRKIVIATGEVTTLAGSAGVTGSADGTGAAAKFSCPMGITTDGANLYVADEGNGTIRKIVITTKVVTTISGVAGVTGTIQWDITTDGTNLYVTDLGFGTIRKVVIATGAVTTIAGSAGVRGSADGAGTSARFDSPCGITTDGTNLYVTDNNTIRKIVIATGVVSTLAGSAGISGATDGIGSTARFNYPYGVTTDGTNLFVVDKSNSTVREVISTTSGNSVVVSVSPTSTSLSTSGTNSFTATVTGNSNTSVIWSVSETGGGSISSSGLYTAPSTAGTFHVKATSVADPSKSATAAVTITLPKPWPMGTWTGPNGFIFTINNLVATDPTSGLRHYSGTITYPGLIGGSMNVSGTDSMVQIMVSVLQGLNTASISVTGGQVSGASFSEFSVSLNGNSNFNSVVGYLTFTGSNTAYNYFSPGAFTRQ